MVCIPLSGKFDWTLGHLAYTQKFPTGKIAGNFIFVFYGCLKKLLIEGTRSSSELTFQERAMERRPRHVSGSACTKQSYVLS